MLNNLPRQYRSDPTVQILANAIQSVLEHQESEAASIHTQLSLDAVTWNLDTEERIAGIIPPPNATSESRRTALKAKWRSGGKLTIEQVQAVCDAWKNGEVEVSFPDGRIHLQFVGSYGVPVDLDTLMAAARLVIPAHLAAGYAIKYLLVRDIHNAMTIGTLQSQQLSNFAF